MGEVDFTLRAKLATKRALEDERRAEAELRFNRSAALNRVVIRGGDSLAEYERVMRACSDAYTALQGGPPSLKNPPRTLEQRVKDAEEILWLAMYPTPSEPTRA